ncbi:MAG: hypothetical protein RIB45_15205 [Marivibrio sp.]|uniref:hypothetical protein n=1 Tax=Marivibrio sp. TaxID=2039719 RepID=UPI0032EE00FF
MVISPSTLAPAARLFTLLLSAVIFAGCAGDGNVANPLDRRATWIDHISGGDIRRACAAGEAVGQRRFVEFRNRAEQVRLYNLTPAQDGGALLQSHALTGGVRLNQWPAFTDVLDPWRGTIVESRLSAQQAAAIEADARAGGLLQPPPVGRKLASRSYFWLVSACTEGQGFALQVWEWPSQGYRERSFADLLHEADATGVPLNPPPKTAERIVNRLGGGSVTGEETFPHYDLIVREDRVEIGRTYRNRGGNPARN